MLSALTEAKNHGAHIVAVNPLPEAGLFKFRDPQTFTGLVRGGTELADDFLQIKLGGDLALFQALGHLLIAAEDAAPGTVVDSTFVASSTQGYDAYAAARRSIDWDAIIEATGLPREQIEQLAIRMATVQGDDHLLGHGADPAQAFGADPAGGRQPAADPRDDRQAGRRGLPRPRPLQRAGRPDDGHLGADAGIVPGRASDAEHGITSPRPHGFDTVATLNAMAAGEIDVFIGMGGNFVSATPDTDATEASMSRVGLTVQISTKPNRSHLVHGTVGLILPTLGRSDRDDAHPGGAQFVTVEDSMSVVHSSQGRLAPVSERLLAEPVIVCRMARALLGPEHPVDWEAMAADYDVIRTHISRVIPGFENYNERVRVKEGFVLPHPPRDTRNFATASGQGADHRQRADLAAGPAGPTVVADHAVPRPVQHHHLRAGRPLPGYFPGPPGGAGQPRGYHCARPGRPADGGRDQ